ncbi:phosphodiesterase [Opitutaceae bacterium TAV5]|nr:phosphodiesterase [Opitutaceae bacterium TAV5]
MRIAVIADTHDHYPPRLPGLLAGADEIWHLGDVCDPSLLTEFEQLGPPLRVILGNNDGWPAWPLTLDLEREGVRFHLVHIPPRRAPAGIHALLHGHTHVPRDETDAAGIRWLNPGCISRPRAGIKSFAWLEVAKGQIINWQLVRV